MWPASHLITGVPSALIALIHLSTNASDTRHKSAPNQMTSHQRSGPSDALSVVCHYWWRAARVSCFLIAFSAAFLWRSSKALLHHNGSAQQFAVPLSRICASIIVECLSGFIWDMSLCGALIHAQSTMCLVFSRAWASGALLLGIYVPACVEWKIDSVLFRKPLALTFSIRTHNLCSLVPEYKELKIKRLLESFTFFWI